MRPSTRRLGRKSYNEVKKDKYLDNYYHTVSLHLGDLLEGGIEIEDLDKVVNSPNSDAEQVLLNFDKLMEMGIDPTIDESELFWSVDEIDSTLDAIIRHPDKFDLTRIYEKMPKWAITECFDRLIENGIQIDVRKLAESTRSPSKVLLKEKFEKYGVEIDINSCIANMSSRDACLLLLNHSENANVSENTEKLVEKIISDETLDNSTRNDIKPLLWRMGLAQ